MDSALIQRLRASAGVVAAAGVIPVGNGTRAAIDWIERKSDADPAFPAVTLQTVSAGRAYHQDGADGLQIKRVRFECFGTSHEQARGMASAAIAEMEAPSTIAGVRFHRSKVAFDRDFPPEDLGGGLKVFRTLIDFMIPYTLTGE